MKNTFKKTLAIIIMVIALTVLASTTAFAAEAETIIMNAGTVREPAFVTIDGTAAYCLERDEKAPDAAGIQYVTADTPIALDELQDVVVNASINDTNPVIAQYAVWATLENEVENYSVLTQLRFGDEGIVEYNALFEDVDGYSIEWSLYEAEGYQLMAIPCVEEIIEEPIVDEPIVDEPIVDEPIIEEPVVDEPIVDEPVVDEPVVEEPVVDEPIVDEPVVDEPVVDEPIVDEPIVKEPVVDEPIVDEPIIEEPIVDEPIIEEPIVDEPIVDEPIVEEPVVKLPEVNVTLPEIQLPELPEMNWDWNVNVALPEIQLPKLPEVNVSLPEIQLPELPEINVTLPEIQLPEVEEPREENIEEDIILNEEHAEEIIEEVIEEVIIPETEEKVPEIEEPQEEDIILNMEAPEIPNTDAVPTINRTAIAIAVIMVILSLAGLIVIARKKQTSK